MNQPTDERAPTEGDDLLFVALREAAELRMQRQRQDAEIRRLRGHLSEMRTAIEREARHREVLGVLAGGEASAAPEPAVATDWRKDEAPARPKGALRRWLAARFGHAAPAEPARAALEVPAGLYLDNRSLRSTLTPRPGWRCFDTDTEGQLRLVFNLCGLDAAATGRCVAEIARSQGRRRDFLPLFLTDGTELGVFTRYGYSFERLPAEADLPGYDAAGRSAILRRRIEHVVAKWGITQIVNLGTPSLALNFRDGRPEVGLGAT